MIRPAVTDSPELSSTDSSPSAPPAIEWPTNNSEYASWLQPRNERASFVTTDALSFNTNSLYNLTAEHVSPEDKKARAEVLENIRAQDTNGHLNERDRKQLGNWLANNLSRIDGAVMNTPVESIDELNFKDEHIGFDELKAIYANNQWPDGTKLTREDALMLKQAAFHFDHYNVVEETINRTIIEDLQSGAKFSEIDGVKTATRADGTVTKYSDLGSHRTLPDGTRIIRSNPLGEVDSAITLKPDGTGSIHSHFTSSPSVTEQTLREVGPGEWKIYEKDGKETGSLSYDKNGDYALATADGDRWELVTEADGSRRMRISENGKLISETNFNTMETQTLDDDGKPITIALGSDKTVRMTAQDGSREWVTDDETFVRRPAGGGTTIDAAGEGVRVEIDKDGKAVVFDRDGNEISTRRNADGSLLASSQDIRVVIKRNGLVDISFGTGQDRTNVVVTSNSVYTRRGNGSATVAKLF